MENEKQAENFKIAISSTIKALAKKQDLNILFSDSPVKESNIINLPKINLFSIDEYQNIRALADSEALKINIVIMKFRKNLNHEARLQKIFIKLLKKSAMKS